jgi:FkbM family methyltransferase
MQFIKKATRHTFLYGAIRRLWNQSRSAQWTTRDQEMLEFYSKFVAPGSLCFDVGANLGNRVKVFLKLQANVVAIEPQNECVSILRAVYGSNRKLTVVHKALGEAEGEAEIMISNAHPLSSLSTEWIESVKKSGRFPEHSWNKKQVVQISTLDKLIEQFGVPSFIKIDVEGYEYQVIKGLSQPVRTISLEFVPEFIESAFHCIDHLQRLGDIRVNYSMGETMSLVLEKWVTSQEMKQILSGFRDDPILWGDIYIQFPALSDERI